MCLRVVLLIIVLAVSLSGCGPKPKYLVSPVPVPGQPLNQPPVLPPPPVPDLHQPPEKDTAPATTSEPQKPATSETATPPPQAIIQQPSITESLDNRSGPMTRGRVFQSGAINEQQPVARTAPPGFVLGSAAYQIPIYMVENEWSSVDLWIQGSKTVEDLSDELRSYLLNNAKREADRLGIKSKSLGTTEGTTKIESKEVLIGKRMSAELTGPDFEIKPEGPQDQDYVEGQPFRWSWHVKPKHAGPALLLEIRVVADPGGGRTPQEPIREVVKVYARSRTLKEIFQELDWWIKLAGGSGVGAVAVGVIKWLLSRRKVKKKEPEG